MSDAGWVIILQALATYVGIASAYFFARPILRDQATESSLAFLRSAETDDPAVKRLFEEAASSLERPLLEHKQRGQRENVLGAFTLVVSLLLFTGAVFLQLSTDPAFAHRAAASSVPAP